MFAGGAPLVSVAVTTFLVNSRHLFYGLTFPLTHLHHPLARAYSFFTLSDQPYAVITPAGTQGIRPSRLLTTPLWFHMSWTLGTLAGSAAGGAFTGEVVGLDFMLTALFLVLTVDVFKATPDLSVLILAITVALAAFALSHGSMLPLAMAALVVLLPVLHTIRRRRSADA